MSQIAPLSDHMLVAAFMANIPDHVYFKDRESRFLSVSLSLARSLGRKVEEILGKTDYDFFDEKDARHFREREVKIMTTGEALVDEALKHQWLDGRETWSLNVAMPMRNDAGEIIGVFGTNKDITAAARLMEQNLEKANRELREMSRLAGMAEAATGVVHNVGNILNGVNVSTSLIEQGLRKFKVEQLGKLSGLLRQHAENLPEFMTRPQGQQVLPFLEALHRDQMANQTQMLDEVQSLTQCVDHIKEIVTIQESYATMRGLVEDIEIAGVVEDALKINQGAFLRHGVTIRRAFEATPKITGERGKILQILHNLLRNAKYALDDRGEAAGKTIQVGIQLGPDGMVHVVVNDNGVGIEPQNLTRIFAQGFTSRKGGHGFGLHSAANAAREMHGSLCAKSDGLGTGATFILQLPVAKITEPAASDEGSA